MKGCKGPDQKDNVEDSAYCKKYFSSVKDFKKHQEETFLFVECLENVRLKTARSLNFVKQ